MSKAEICRNRMYKKAALADMGYQDINDTLDIIIEECNDIHYDFDDDEMLINALDGDEDEAWEFKMLFTALENESYQLKQQFYDYAEYDEDAEQKFNDCSVALIGNRFRSVGFDDFEEDYFSLTSYESELAFTESGKRIMRNTKAEMLSQIGQTLGIILSYYNVKMKYDNLKGTIDILKEKNTSILKQIRDIESAYALAHEDEFRGKSNDNFDNLIKELPDLFWVQ